MSSRDYYKVTYSGNDASKRSSMDSHDILDNDTEFNANQFKLYDDFTTDLRINFNPLRNNYVRTESRYQDADSTRNYQDTRNVNGTRGYDDKDCRNKTDPNDSGVDMENGNTCVSASSDGDLLENEVMVDPWSSMDSTTSPLTDSGPSASDDCTPSTSSEPRVPLHASSPLSSDARRLPEPSEPKSKVPPKDKARSRDLTLELESLEAEHLPRRPHFLDDDYQSKSNIECRIPKPHFLDHSPSPDEFDERSDITNPNFLDDEVDGDEAQKKSGALPKRPIKPSTLAQEDRPHRTNFRSTLHYGLESAARSSERDKRASQLYRGTWPGEREWTGQDAASVRSFSSNGSADGHRPSTNLDNKIECVCSLISLLSLSPENNADLSGPLLEMSRSVESCIAMRQAGCIPLLVQLIHSKVPRETRDRAAKALRNIIHTQTDDKAGRREARVWKLLEQVREYCYVLEDIVEARKEGKEVIEDDNTKHPSQSVAALMKLSFDEEHRHVVCQLGGLQALAALVSGDQAAHGSRTDDNTCLTMRKYAGMTLTNLTFGDGNNKSLLCSFKDFMLALVEQLESPNDDMRQVTAAVLRNLSWRADANSKQVLREVGAVKGLTKAAMTCQKEATLKSVLSALWNLTAHCSMNKVALCSVDGALGFLVDMLSYDSPTKTLAIVENAGGIMRNVSSHIAVREDYRQILRERNCLSVLLQHLKSPSLTVVSNSCGTLWNLSARCPQDQQFLWDNGAVPMLRSLIHSKHKMIAMGSSAALKNLLNSKPGKTHIIALDATARSMNLPALPTLGARKQKALEQELDQNLAETCENIEPATSPSTSNREEKNLYTATERQLALNLERHRMTASSPLMGTLTSQISLSHSAQLASYLSCSNTLLKGALVSRSTTGSSNDVNRSDSKDSVTSTHSDSVFDRVTRPGKVPVPTPRNKDLVKAEPGSEAFKAPSTSTKDNFLRYPTQPPVPPPRSSTDMRTNYTESGYDVDQDSCDQPIDYSRKYSETKAVEPEATTKKPEGKKYPKKESSSTFGDYQETDLDQPTDYSLRYAEHQSETGSDTSEPPGPSVHEDTIQHFATEGTPYETPIIFSTATSMSDLRVIVKDGKPKAASVKEHPEVMTHSDEKDTCSIEDPPRHDNDRAIVTPQNPIEPIPEKSGVFDTKFSSGMISPEKPVNYCDEGTPGYFSRVSSLSSLGEEDNLAKKNAMATINVELSPQDQNTNSAKDKEGSKAVTFASSPPSSGPSPAAIASPRFVEDTPLMFSRSSSLGSLPDCDTPHHDDQGSVVSEVSRLPSGCLSPSEIPDSPGAIASAPQSPRGRGRPQPDLDVSTEPSTPPPDGVASVFEERVSRFMVEHTPAQFSTATSLSSLTIDDEPRSTAQVDNKTSSREAKQSTCRGTINYSHSRRADNSPPQNHIPEVGKGTQTPGDTCQIYYTEDTPAILSKAGSNSNLSVLSIDSAPIDLRKSTNESSDVLDTSENVEAASSDSSNLSDSGDLLEECIQKGIAKVVKNKGPPSDVSSVPYRDEFYRSLPPYLRSSTETVRMCSSAHGFTGSRGSHSRASNGSQSSSSNSPPPPLPPKQPISQAPPRPPHPDDGGRHSTRPPPRLLPPPVPALARNDSLSSLSLDSFGSTDQEIFEETVQNGVSSVHGKHKAHSAERAAEPSRVTERGAEPSRMARAHKSLDRGDRFVPRARAKPRRDDWPLTPPRPATTATRDVTRDTRDVGRDAPRRSSSLSSLSNDSFGSTDKEVFERCVRAGMSRRHDRRDERRPRSEDRLDSREGRERRRRRGADRMGGSLSRVLADAIARGAGESRPLDNRAAENRVPSNRSKNVRPPSAPRARAGDHAAAPARDTTTPTTTTITATPETSTGYDGITTTHYDGFTNTDYDGTTTGFENITASVDPDHSYTTGSDTTYSATTTLATCIGFEDNTGSDHVIANGCDDVVTIRTTDVTSTGCNQGIASSGFNAIKGSDRGITTKNFGATITATTNIDYEDGVTAGSDDVIATGCDEVTTTTACDDSMPEINHPNSDIVNTNGFDHVTTSGFDAVTTRTSIDSDHVTTTTDCEDITLEMDHNNIAKTTNGIHVTKTCCDNTVSKVTASEELIRSFTNYNASSMNQSHETTRSEQMDQSNECLAVASVNTTLESETVDELNRSNESYAAMEASLDQLSFQKLTKRLATGLSRSVEDQWSDLKLDSSIDDPLSFHDIKIRPVQEDGSKRSTDTWNDNTCPDDVTFPTISCSVHMVSSIRSEVVDPNMALPDLLEKSDSNMTSSRPDLTNKLDEEAFDLPTNLSSKDGKHSRDVPDTKLEDIPSGLLESVPEPSFMSLVDDEQRLDSLMASAIEKEAARLAAQLKSSQYGMEASVTSVASLDLDSVKPPSNLGSLLSLSASGQWEETSAQTSKKSKSRKKSLPVAMLVKCALGNMHQGSSEHLDSNPVSFLDNVKPPSEMEHLDMESSIISVSSIVSEVAETREKTPVVFDLKQPIQDFPLCNTFTVFHDLDKVNPPSLFDEMAESTVEFEQSTAHQVYEDCVSTLNVVTDIPSGSENCTPLPSDLSSVESTPKRQRSNYLTPKERRHMSKDRYQTYTIADTLTENDDLVLEVETEGYMTWTKSESDKSDDYVTATSEAKPRKKVSAKQRRQEDRARYQTQTVDIQNILTPDPSPRLVDTQIESLKQRLAAKKTMKQRRMEDAERFRTRTLSEDIPPSPTFVTRDANFENVETTTGYDSLSSNEPNHQQLPDERRDDDVFSRDADSGLNDDDFELNSAQMQTYTKSFRNYLPVIESPTAVDLCVVNNLKNIEMTASYRNAQSDKHPSSSDFAGYEGDSAHSDSDTESPQSRPKPKIIKPEIRRDISLDSNESAEKDEAPKAVRGRKKAMYVSPYRRNTPAKKTTTTPPKPASKLTPTKPVTNFPRANASAKTTSKPSTSKPPSANGSPKKTLNKSPTKIAQPKQISTPPTAAKPLPLERQGTFTKEQSSVPPKDLPVPDRKYSVPKVAKAGTSKTTAVTTSPSRLPQLNRYSRPTFAKSNSGPKETKLTKKPSEGIKTSASNQSLQSNESGKTVTLARGSRQGSTSSVNSQSSKTNAKDVESRIASLWKKVEQSKTVPKQPDKRVWIESEKTTPRLIRSSTFEGQPKQSQVPAALKQKSAIGMRVSQIPSLRPKTTPGRVGPASPSRKPATRTFSRKPVNGQISQ